ncbi:MAG: hypothetical protein IKB02_09030 [Clostridia bacterium]|nr:hypothetical protein [Clostridia bacterium]
MDKRNNSRPAKKKPATTSQKPKQQDALVEMPMSFARELIKQIVYNPKNSSSQKSYTYSLYTKENILKWLQSPSSNETSLRNASNYMYLSSMHYQRLIQYYAGLYYGYYVISPLGFEKTNGAKRESIAKQYYKVTKFLELIDVPSLVRSVVGVCLRDGIYYGVKWSDKSSTFIQKLDPDICKLTSICNGTFLYAVDMTKLQGKLEFYPAAFTDMYAKYLQTGEKYQEVPPDISVCVKADDTIIDFSVPPFAAVMPSLYTIANTENLQETANELKNYKMLTGKVPVDANGNPLIGWDLYLKYYNQLSNALGENVGLAITPFDMDQFSFDQKSGVSDVDDIAKSVANFWSTAGTSGLLHGVANDTSGVTKLSIKNDETYIFGIVKQLEKVLNRYLKTTFSGTIKFKITFLPITVFNRDELVKEYKEAASFGLGKSHYAAALGIPQYDIAGLTFLEEDLLGFGELVPMRNTYNSGEEDGEKGRPQKKDEDLSDDGASTRDNDTNANR